jgi:hypothetical protein
MPAERRTGCLRGHCAPISRLTASTTLANSTGIPSPVILTMRPWCSAIFMSSSCRDPPSFAARRYMFKRVVNISDQCESRVVLRECVTEGTRAFKSVDAARIAVLVVIYHPLGHHVFMMKRCLADTLW